MCEEEEVWGDERELGILFGQNGKTTLFPAIKYRKVLRMWISNWYKAVEINSIN